MRKTILQLQEEASSLEPSKQNRKNLEKKASELCNRFLDTASEKKAYQIFDKSINSLLQSPITDEPQPEEDVLNELENEIIPPGLNPTSGNHFGYIPGGGLMSAALGDYIAAVTNRYAGVYFSSPGAVLLETRLINWMSDLIGYNGETSGGYLSSGGSIANLSAVVTARESAGLSSDQFSKTVVYLSTQTHHCVERALNIAGMKDAVRRFVPIDEKYRMIPGELKKLVDKDAENGLIPWMVVASAGSTDTGAVDPLDSIAEIAAEHQLWFHVDAAYGGFFLLTDGAKKQFRGIEKSDSVVLDPHKGLFLPYGSGALVVKDVEKLAAAHSYSANYMKDTEIDFGIYSPADVSPELSKHFRGLRMWLPLKLHGVRAFRSALEEKLRLAMYAWERLNEMDEIEMGPKPQLTVFMFRWKPDNGNADEMNNKLHRAVIDDGRVFLSTTRINESFVLRLAILSVRTHLEEVDRLIEVLKEKMEMLRDME